MFKKLGLLIAAFCLVISSFFVAALLVAIFIQPFYRDRNKICSWCKSKKLSFISGKEGNWFWEYRNKDGSQDKRVKDNFQRADYFSEYECLKCGAITYFQHYVNKNPSNKVNVWKRRLQKKGEGKSYKVNYFRRTNEKVVYLLKQLKEDVG